MPTLCVATYESDVNNSYLILCGIDYNENIKKNGMFYGQKTDCLYDDDRQSILYF